MPRSAVVALVLVACPSVLGFSTFGGVRLPARAAAAAQVPPRALRPQYRTLMAAAMAPDADAARDTARSEAAVSHADGGCNGARR